MDSIALAVFMSSSDYTAGGHGRGMISLDLLLALMLFSGIMLAISGIIHRVDTICDELSTRALHLRDEIWTVSRCQLIVRSITLENTIGDDPGMISMNVLEQTFTRIPDREPCFVRFPHRTLVCMRCDSLGTMTFLGDLPTARKWWR